MPWITTRSFILALVTVGFAVVLSTISIADTTSKILAFVNTKTVRNSTSYTTMTKTPVYFFSHGGVSSNTLYVNKCFCYSRFQPNVQYDTRHPAYPVLQQIGQEITQKVKPKAVVVFSAHWSGGKDEIYVNKDEKADLIYEFVFPSKSLLNWADEI